MFSTLLIRFKHLFFFSSLTLSLHAGNFPGDLPWFTGPLLTPAREIIAPGKVLFQGYLSATKFNGIYNDHWKTEHRPTFWQVQQLNVIETGITSFMDVQAIPSWYYNSSQDASAVRFADLTVAFNFQLVRDEDDPRFPRILFQVAETFPTGQYQHLDPNKHGTDIGGAGAYTTALKMTFAKIFYWVPDHFLSIRFNTGYYASSQVHVEGLNAYGGGEGTNGTMHLGYSWINYFSFEYSLTNNWNLASDLVYNYSSSDRFTGCPGFNCDGTPASIGAPHSNSISISPAIEYAFSNNIGLIGGVWMTLFGQNTSRFVSGIISFVAVF